MIRRILCLLLIPFAHGRLTRIAGIWEYYECRHCGQRAAVKTLGCGHLIGPRDERWLAGGGWTDESPIHLPRGHSSNYRPTE